MTDRPSSAITFGSDELLEHWQGHRRVTRRVVDAFPEHELFHFSVGGMRPCAALAQEMIGMCRAGMRGLATRTWTSVDEVYAAAAPKTKADLLAQWDEVTTLIETLWPQIPAGRFEEVDKAFGVWEGRMSGLFLYWIDNEIHHRGQAYVYLRALGIEPPPFYERS